MDDTISRAKAIEAMKAARVEDDGTYKWRTQRNLDLEFAAALLETIPPAQPEIIRCKDCKHYYFADNRIPQEQRYVCDFDGDRWKPEDFCSFAERRTE